MLGWDVGYVWPLLEGVVTSPQSVVFAMGCPSRTEPDSSTSTTNRSSLSNNNNSNPANVSPRDRAPHPPPYESIAGSAASTSSTASGSNSPTSPRAGSRPSRRHAGRRNTDSSDTSHDAIPEVRPLGGRLPRWPHKASSTFACLSCVLGLYNISRFSVLVYIYKGSFIVQFLLLSMIIGIPLLYLLMILGQYLGAGLLDMWYISPAFKGLGFAMLYIYVILGVYNAVPLSWLFVYFKDSFITLKDSYKWGRCHYNFARNDCLKALNSSAADYYGWSVPSYFHGRVLGRRSGEFQFGELKFEVAFNLCLVWLIIFICLSRGPKTLGKVLYIMGTLPVILLIMITMRMSQQWGQGVKDIFASPWKPVMLDSNAWLVAAREVFLTWGLMGCVTLHICSHNKISTNVTKTLAAVAFVTIVVLILSSFLFSCAANVLSIRNLSFASSSFEEEASVRVLKSGISSSKNLSVSIMIIGESIISREKFAHLSGYQVLRLATEVFPAALAVEGVRSISSFWSICFYTAMIMFGLGQQAVLWFCVIESVISINYKVFKAWHTTLTFITCNLAFLLGLPLTSNVGIYIIYYFDFCVGMLWWIIVIYLIMLFAVLFIRGRPCGTDQLVKMVCRRPSARSWVLPILTFQWNILLPVALLVLTIGFLRSSSMNPSSVSGWMKENYNYWPEWAKTLMFCIQVFPLMITMTTFLFQVFKVFILKVDLPLTERLRYLCCPVLPPPSANSHHSLHSTSSLDQGSTNSAFVDDPPPKYTPPPSYSTATSRMLAKRFQLPPAMECSIDLDALENEQEDQKIYVSALSPRSDNSVLRVTELRSDSNMTAQVT